MDEGGVSSEERDWISEMIEETLFVKLAIVPVHWRIRILGGLSRLVWGSNSYGNKASDGHE